MSHANRRKQEKSLGLIRWRDWMPKVFGQCVAGGAEQIGKIPLE
jgi:hypothetical protein